MNDSFRRPSLDSNLNPDYSTTRRSVIADPQQMAEMLSRANNSGDEFETVLFWPEGERRKGSGGLRAKGYFKIRDDIPAPFSTLPAAFSAITAEAGIAKPEGHLKEQSESEISTPLITVVTVVYNGENVLERTILSVINQSYDNVEYLIIDGGSTDGTLEIIRKYEHAIDYWVSEQDKGIYDAMNKGIDLATGEWINFMNAGDTFVNKSTLTDSCLHRLSDYALVYGNEIRDNNIIHPLPLKKLEIGEIMACHQSMFFNIRSTLKQDMRYDVTYKIYADYALVNKLYLKHKHLHHINLAIAVYQGGGISSRISTQKRIDKYRALLLQYGLIGFMKGVLYRALKPVLSKILPMLIPIIVEPLA